MDTPAPAPTPEETAPTASTAPTAPNVFSMAADILSPPPVHNFERLPHQEPPTKLDSPNYNPELGTHGWFLWLLLAGRGAGKTHSASMYVDEFARSHPGCRIAIIAPTLGDARSACVDGPSGLRAMNDTIRVRKTPDYYLEWPNGSRADIYGAHTEDDVERLRAGGNRHLVWAEELAAWRYLQDAWDQMEFGLRLGNHPHVIASTTPKNRPLIKRLVADPKTIVTRGTTLDNPHLHETTRQRLLERYKGTRLGKQELYGEIVDDIAGALWSLEDIARGRITYEEFLRHVPFPLQSLALLRPDEEGEDGSPSRPLLPAGLAEVVCLKSTYLDHVVVAVDPAMSNKKNSDETGIVIAARLSTSRPCPFPHLEDDGPDGATDIHLRGNKKSGCVVVIGDRTIKGSPEAWGREAINAYETAMADRILGEVNNGGDLVENNVKVLDRTVPFKQVRASRGKAIRAEPIANLYEQGRVHHVGEFEQLEDQMVTWEPDAEWSPDRLDALVWAVTDLGIVTPVRRVGNVTPIMVNPGKTYWSGA